MKALQIFFVIQGLLLFRALSAQPLPSRPNVILIVGDDMRYDSFEPTGGPEWFDSPSINRIAEQGANFKDFFCVYSLCTPGRSSILTGLYSHSNGATGNSSTYYPYLPTIATILDTAGYHTAMIGKYQAYYDPQPGWDYWMARSKFTNGSYYDLKFNVNGTVKIIEGHVTQIISDSATNIISAIDTPFFVFIGHEAPHQPAISLPEDSGIYAGETMPLPSNFDPYKTGYPSFLYEGDPVLTPGNMEKTIEDYFECVKDIDRNVEDIFNTLISRHLLNKTLIIFTSDNGYINGEHHLLGKGMPYEPSMRLPMFIRYPAWFAQQTTIDVPIGLNVDIAPTILEAAGISSEPYHFQGVSLHKLATGELKRDLFLYENIKLADEAEDPSKPSMRAIRSKHYKYNWYQCDQLTEEFFNLSIDPEENINLITDPDYAALISTYRELLDSLREVFHDTLTIDSVIKPCHLVGKKQTGTSYVIEDPIALLEIATNPFTNRMTIALTGTSEIPVMITVFNILGQVMMTRQAYVLNAGGLSSLVFDTSILSSGIYLIQAVQDDYIWCELALKE